MLVSRDAAFIERARFLSTQAREPAAHYQHETYGYNYRMSNVAAAIGVGQLGVLDARVTARRRIFARYRAALGQPGLHFMPEPEGARSTRWLTTLTVDPETTGVTRDDLLAALARHQIEARPLWKPMHLQPVFADHPSFLNGVSDDLFGRGLCLPSGSSMTDADVERVCQGMRGALGEGRLHARAATQSPAATRR